MTRRSRYVRSFVAILAAAAAALASAPRPARAADAAGRMSLMNDIDLLSNPNAMIDAMILRMFFTVDHVGGKNVKIVADLRSDVPLVATTSVKYGAGIDGNIKTPFNGACHGDDFDLNREKCKNIAVRDQTLGQLSELAGVYDLFVQFGQTAEGHTTVSIGRKTVYEAGLVTVDGLVIERSITPETRVGGFAGLAPDPLTRLFTPLYQTAGGYYAYAKMGTWVRVGANALNYSGDDANKFGADNGAVARATLFNQNFFLLSKGVSIATYANVDVLPGPVDRLIYADFTYKPTSRYRFRLNASRFRPVEFDRSPELLDGGVFDPTLIAAYQASGANAGPFKSRTPEVVPADLRIKPIDLVKLDAHYVTANSFTPYVSAEYRIRELDSKNEILADVGVYTYDPYDTGITARLRAEYQSGFDASGIRIGGTFERELSENLVAGGGIDLASLTYTNREPLVDSHYTTADTTAAVNGLLRMDRPKGLSYFLEAYYFMDNRKPGAGEPGMVAGDTGAGILAPAPKTATQISLLLGVTLRFGAGR